MILLAGIYYPEGYNFLLPVTGEKAVIHSEIRYYTNVTVYLASDFTVVFGV